MINTSTEFKLTHERNSSCITKANILLKNGTLLEIDNSKLSQGGTKISDGVSGTNKFSIGTAISNKLVLNLNNSYEEFSDYDFTDAVITVWVGKVLSGGREWIKKGVYNTDDPTATPAVLTLECLDNMSKFDTAYDGGLSFPTTIQTIVQHCCTRCGILLVNGQFPNYSYQIEKDPFGENRITYRAIIAYCALLAGCYARCNVDGRLELKWYDTAAFNGIIDGGMFDKTTESSYQTGDNLDGGNFTDYNSGDTADGGAFTDALPYHHIYSFSSLSVSTEDVVITGIRVKASDGEDSSGQKVEGETYLCGAEGYILEVSGNPLIEPGKAKAVAEYLAGRVVGMRFRPFTASAIGDPSWEAGDAAMITDRKGNSYYTYLTNVTYSTGGYANISCDAEPAARHSADRYEEINKIVADIKKDSLQQLTEYGKLLEQMNGLAVNAMGYYETTVVGDDGSKIHYMHDKPLLSDSKIVYKQSIDGFFWSKDGGKTWTSGIDKDGNAVMNVIAAIRISSEWIDTRGFKAADDDGNVTFEIDANTGKVRIEAESFSLSGKTIEDIANGSVTKLDQKLSALEIFNRLTDNGKLQGIYMENGQLYVNFSYARGGTLTLGGDRNTKGIFQILNTYGMEVVRGDKEGITVTKGIISGTDISGSVIHNDDSSFIVTKDGSIISEADQNVIEGSDVYTMINRMTLDNSSIDFDTILKKGSWSNYKNVARIISFSSQTLSNSALCIGSVASISLGKIEGGSVAGGIHLDLINRKMTVFGSLYSQGSKSRIADTENYGKRELYCYETATPYFGDIGTGKTDENGICYVSIDAMFSETVNAAVEYSVFLQKEGPGDIWVESKDSAFFVVKGTANLPFSWEIKVIQMEYEYTRLEDYNLQRSIMDDSDELKEIFDKELEYNDKEMEEIVNENFKSISGD